MRRLHIFCKNYSCVLSLFQVLDKNQNISKLNDNENRRYRYDYDDEGYVEFYSYKYSRNNKELVIHLYHFMGDFPYAESHFEEIMINYLAHGPKPDMIMSFGAVIQNSLIRPYDRVFLCNRFNKFVDQKLFRFQTDDIGPIDRYLDLKMLNSIGVDEFTQNDTAIGIGDEFRKRYPELRDALVQEHGYCNILYFFKHRFADIVEFKNITFLPALKAYLAVEDNSIVDDEMELSFKMAAEKIIPYLDYLMDNLIN